MTSAHSTWSASGFEQKMLCPGSHVLQQGKPRRSSQYAAEGTAAHQVLTWALQESRPAAAYIGRVIEADGFTFTVDEDMAGHVQVCIDYVTDAAGDEGVIFADIRVNYSQYLDTPELEAWGTADVIIARGDELIVIDFKYGMGVEVSAERNPQMSLYALGALQAYQGLVADFERVRMVISQPRIKKAASEFDISVEELETWGRSTARSAVNTCRNAMAVDHTQVTSGVSWDQVYLRPGEKQCKFCSAKAECPALRAEVVGTVFEALPASPDEFAEAELPFTGYAHTEPQWLAACLSKADLIEDWVKAIRAETERRLLAGESVPGYKLVPGKKGARQWVDAKVAEETLKSMRVKLEDMYDLKLISPTTADKLAKAGTIGPRQWPRVQALFVQSQGKPHVAPVDDPRPALEIKPVVDDFESLA
jgi:hypothetical protein